MWGNKLVTAVEELGQNPILDTWRGWNRTHSNFTPPYEGILLPMFVLADKSCPSNRACYLLEIEKVESHMTEERVTGRLYHEVYQKLIEESKKLIYNMKGSGVKEINQVVVELGNKGAETIETILKIDPDHIKLISDINLIKRRMLNLWNHEVKLMGSFLYFFLFKSPSPTKDTLTDSFVPFHSETQIDGSGLHMSKSLKIDSFILSGKHVVLDIKTGEPKPFHKLTTTGYALALENYYGTDSKFDIGCVFYVNFKKTSDVPIIDCEIHPITNALRKDFIEERNTKIKIVAERTDPGCPKSESCPYYFHCKELVQ